MTVKIVKMDIANYVNKVGKLVNQSTKYNAKLDRVSITNLVLLLHLDKLAKWVSKLLQGLKILMYFVSSHWKVLDRHKIKS